MFEPIQKKKDPPTDGESTSRYSAVKKQTECSNLSDSNSNVIPSTDVLCFITEVMSYSKQLNSIENSLNVFQYDTMDLNKFWLKYFGVVNLSDHKLTILELTVIGKGLKFSPTHPKYCHGKLKESIDKFF